MIFVLPTSAARAASRSVPPAQRPPASEVRCWTRPRSPTASAGRERPDDRESAKLYINTGVVTDKSDIYNILRPLLKQTVSYTYRRGAQVTDSGTGWVERIVVDHP